jgi:integrase
MTKVRLPYVKEYTDVRGKLRRQFRRKGFRQVNLPGAPGSAEFMAAYQAAMSGVTTALEPGKASVAPGSVSELVALYYGSAQWAALAPVTKSTYRNIIEKFRAAHGTKPVAKLRSEHLASMIDKKAATPAAARNLLRMMRTLLAFAVARKFRKDNPALEVQRAKYRQTGFHSWTEDEISRFEAHHPIGSKARLALALLLYTAQRRTDVVRMGRQHVRNGILTVHQQKTGVELHLPVLPELQTAIDACPSAHLTFLVTTHGKPFTPAGFGNWFREKCREAKIPERCSAHGLRKAGCRRMAEAGMSANQIMSVSGHVTLKEVAVYTRAAEQKKLAAIAIQALSGPQREQSGV